jgi:myo-inositol 2-dehydrogenase/D-chiro-inositol 1-dehydrogenase
MRLGLIGAGRWGALQRDAFASLGAPPVRVLVSSAASAARVQDAWGVEAVTDLDAFLAAGLDAVVIASPNHLHARHAIRALDAGLHVLLEKPMALTVTDAEAVRDAAVRAGRVLALGHEIRTFAWAEEARRRIDDGSLGTVRHLDLALWRRPYRAGAGGWKADPAKVGSSILEEPIHYLDLARWWLGDPDALQAFATSRAGREGGWENLDVRLFFAGAQATVRRSIAAWGHRVDLTIVGDDGAFRAVWAGAMDADPAPRQEAWLHHGSDRDAPAERLELRAPSGHAHDLPRQARAFLDACAGRGAPLAGADDGVEAVRLCLRAERSLRDGQVRTELA